MKVDFTGTFIDEFQNTFTLNSDHTAYIKLGGNEKVDTTSWNSVEEGGRTFATIEFNGDYSHFYLCDGFLYRSETDMISGSKRIRVTYQ